MRVLTTLLMQAFQPGGPVETERLVQARDRVINAHYKAFAAAHAVVADAETPLAFYDVVTHAVRLRDAILAAAATDAAAVPAGRWS
jgi:hypothetical protein